jgi:uncharacterized membrane protein
MFWIFKILPDWIWWLLLLSGILGVLLSYFAPLKPYQLSIKIFGLVVVATTLFVFGMLYADNTWKLAAQELESKVVAAEAKSQQVNEIVKEKIVSRTQVVKIRGAETVKYIDREVVKTDSACIISPEFVQAHNTSTEPIE